MTMNLLRGTPPDPKSSWTKEQSGTRIIMAITPIMNNAYTNYHISALFPGIYPWLHPMAWFNDNETVLVYSLWLKLIMCKRVGNWVLETLGQQTNHELMHISSLFPIRCHCLHRRARFNDNETGYGYSLFAFLNWYRSVRSMLIICLYTF